MITKHIKPDSLQEAADIIASGGTVIFPTETVYGLGANALDKTAVTKIYKAKGRPADNPLIVHIADVSQLENVARDVPKTAYELFRRYSPGPLTVVLKRKDTIPAEISAGLDTVAVRIPSHPVANSLIKLSGCPIAAPSANLSGRPSPTCYAHVKDEMDGRVDMIIDGGESDIGLESTVVSLAGDEPILLRPGAVTLRQLEDVLGRVELSRSIFAEYDGSAASPGMKYRHYAPKAKVVLVKGYDAEVRSFIKSKIRSNEGCGVLCFDGEEEFFCEAVTRSYGIPSEPRTLAHNLFDALRFFDSTPVSVIYARVADGNGIEMAVLNRLIKAAGFTVIEV
ncbi:MAG: threonylcarbamoyl-AMP synthase [Clostridia bacterium]|nr:threonylcarbamoyl-AMP synthase [Clostridia bacterium]